LLHSPARPLDRCTALGSPTGAEGGGEGAAHGHCKGIGERPVERGLLETVVSPIVGRHLHAAEVLAEARTRFREELDYGLEAERMRRFSGIHARERLVVIPRVIDDPKCAAGADGRAGDRAGLRRGLRAAQDDRRRWAETLWRFVFRGVLVGGIFNADPHPGNYVFQPDGRVAFLDFGCVQPLSAQHQRMALQVHLDAAARDEASFRRHAVAYIQPHPGRHEELTVASCATVSSRCSCPRSGSRGSMSRAWSRNEGFGQRAAQGPARRGAAMPEGLLFMNRLQFGFYSVLARLDVEVDYSAVERTFLAEARSLGSLDGARAPDSRRVPAVACVAPGSVEA